MNPIQRIKKNMATPFRETKSTIIKQHAHWQPVFKHINQTLSNQKAHNQQIERPDNYASMLQTWEVEPEQIRPIMKALVVEKWLYAGLSITLAALALFTPIDLEMRILLLTLSPGFCVVALTKEWRLMCLHQQKFISFKTWVMHGCP